MKARRRGGWAALILVGALVAPPGAGAQKPGLVLTAEQRAQANEHAEAGKRKYNLGRFLEAAEEFKTVYGITGKPGFLFNIAQAYRLGNVPERALFFYRAYLREDETADRVEIDRRIAELQDIMAKQAQSNDAPPHGLRADANADAAASAKPAEPPSTSDQAPSSNQAPSVVETAPVAPAAVVGPEVPGRRLSLQRAGYGLLAVGVAGLVVGGAMSGLTVAASNDVHRAAVAHQMYSTALDDEQARGRLYQSLQLVGYGVGGAAVLVGAVLIAKGRRSITTSHAQLLPSVGPGGVRVALSGSF